MARHTSKGPELADSRTLTGRADAVDEVGQGKPQDAVVGRQTGTAARQAPLAPAQPGAQRGRRGKAPPPVTPVSMLGWQATTTAYAPQETRTQERAGDVAPDARAAGANDPGSPESATSHGSASAQPSKKEARKQAERARRLTRMFALIQREHAKAEESEQTTRHAAQAADQPTIAPLPVVKPLVITPGKKRRAARNPLDTKGRRVRSKAAGAVALVATLVTVLVALMVATPLGSTGGLATAFQAYSNLAPWSPPPTPTPQPHLTSGSVNPGRQAIIADIQAVFGPNSAGALNIARCESDYDPNARNVTPIGSSHAAGVFQILYPSTWSSTSYAKYSPYDAWANVRAAYEIFKRDGFTWREWACKP